MDLLLLSKVRIQNIFIFVLLFFQDYALQLFPHILRACQTGDVVPATMILAATSGDTGGALLSGIDFLLKTFVSIFREPENYLPLNFSKI